MADDKLRIPRVAFAVLVLGAACSDDGNGSDDTDGGRDAGGHDPDAGDERDAGEHDAGAGDAGGDDAGGGNGVDVSSARIEQIARDFCAQGFRCDVEEVVDTFDDEPECRTDSVSYWEDYISVLGEECIDAQLDLYACAALLSCDESVEDDCAELVTATENACS